MYKRQDFRRRVEANPAVAWSLLVELVKNGRVRVPRRMIRPGPHRHGAGTQGSIICATCHRALPRLKYTDWQFAHNGVVTYRGRDFPVRQPVPR